ncbi:MAG: hypothetical protein H6838_08610 [Planctomycetes bacterium]|nr:hypothetical protein [Planctomycetota bacterium]
MLRLHEELPDLTGCLRWLDRPALPLPGGVRDQAVALLFWRLGCVHSRLALDVLADLVQRFAGRPFAAIAVHVPVAAAERDDARVQRAVGDRPVNVAIDAQRRACRALGLRGLPHVVLLDARGRVQFSGVGEPDPERLANAVSLLLRTFEGDGLAPGVPLAAPRSPGAAAPRLRPSGLVAAEEGVWLAAAGHHRLYCVAPDGAVRRTIGSGHRGRADGPALVASFVEPGGLALRGDEVLVADPVAHSLRAVDRRDGRVETWCGNGARSTDRQGGGYGLDQGLAAPGALAVHDGVVYLSQAGTHQLWQVDRQTGAASAWLGARERTLRDGHDEATFAEPLGLCASNEALFVADAGFGAVRQIDLGHTFVRTIAQGLQRPAAVALAAEELFVADAWRPAVLRGDPGGALQPWLDASHGLIEPVALAVVGEDIWVADAGADAIFVVSLLGAPAPRRLVLTGAPSLPEPLSSVARAMSCEPVELLEFSDVTLCLRPRLPEAEQFDASLPCTVHVGDEGRGMLACDVHHATAPIDEHLEVLVPIAERGEGALRIRVELTSRGLVTGLPTPRSFDFLVPVRVTTTGEQRAEIVPSA